MIKDQPKVYICEQTRKINKRSQGRSYDNHSDYFRTILAFGLDGTWSQAFAWLRNFKRKKMEQLLLHKIRILECQLSITEDTWLKRIWQDHINALMLKVSRLNKTN